MRSAPRDDPQRGASEGRPSELGPPDRRAGMAVGRTIRKTASRWRALRRLRPRRALLAAILRPRAGRSLPDELRAENVAQLVEALPRGVRGVEFQRLVGRIKTGPIHQGNRVELFFHGEDAFRSVRQAIAGASQEILLETYILKDDATGRRLLGLLGSAAARGVTVKVLADAFGSWTTKRAFWREMRNLRIEAWLFHPFWSHLWDHLFRDHRKVIVIDRQIAFTGGMNVANEYGSSRHRTGVSWRDTHVRMVGPAA